MGDPAAGAGACFADGGGGLGPASSDAAVGGLSSVGIEEDSGGSGWSVVVDELADVEQPRSKRARHTLTEGEGNAVDDGAFE